MKGHANGKANGHTSNPTTSPIKSKFLPSSSELGLVAVGFSGGQVCILYTNYKDELNIH